MSYPTRPLASHLRQPPASRTQSTGGQSPALVARIMEKKVELENLKELRDLSAGLAGQMQSLEQKLATLADGTEAIAAVLSNWHNVLRAIHMASMKIPKPLQDAEAGDEATPEQARDKGDEAEVPLPQTLVRIPTQAQQRQADPMSQDSSGGGGE